MARIVSSAIVFSSARRDSSYLPEDAIVLSVGRREAGSYGTGERLRRLSRRSEVEVKRFEAAPITTIDAAANAGITAEDSGLMYLVQSRSGRIGRAEWGQSKDNHNFRLSLATARWRCYICATFSILAIYKALGT
jgi:hypothetical protein